VPDVSWEKTVARDQKKTKEIHKIKGRLDEEGEEEEEEEEELEEEEKEERLQHQVTSS
jgi:hypothetical protein